MLPLQHRLQETSVKEVLAGGMHQFVDVLQTELNQIGEALNHDYFHSLGPPAPSAEPVLTKPPPPTIAPVPWVHS